MGSAGVKATAVVDGEVDAYVHAGGQYEWDSAAPVAVALRGGPARQPHRRVTAGLQPGRPAAARPARLPSGGRRPALLDADRRTIEKRAGLVMTDTAALPAQPAQTPRGRGHLHHPRGGRRARATRAAVLRRQGLDRHASAGREGVLPGAHPVPGACTSTPGTTSPRSWSSATAGSTSSACNWSSPACRRRSTPARSSSRRTAPATGSRRRCCSTPWRRAVHRDLRRRPARRGQGAGQGADLLLPRRVRPVGPEEPAARAVEPVQRADPPRREHPGLPAVELDRARHLALHPARGHRPARRSTSRTTARSSTATGCSTPSTSSSRPAPGRAVEKRRVRYRTVGDASLTAAVESRRRHGRQAVIDEVASTRITERGATRGDDKFSEASMEDRKREGYF